MKHESVSVPTAQPSFLKLFALSGIVSRLSLSLFSLRFTRSQAIEEDTLRDYFSPYGEVRNCKLVKDPNTGASKGVAFVHFSR